MTAIATAERQLYDEMWGHERYAAFSPGAEYLPLFLDMVGTQRGTVLDAGTGASAGALALQAAGFSVFACDLTDAGRTTPEAKAIPFLATTLWRDLGTVAYVAHIHRAEGGGGLVQGPSGRYVFDYVYCTDVLEHIPESLTMLAVSRMLEVSRAGAFFSVAFDPDQFGAIVGRPLHQTVRPFEWWKAQLAEVGTVVEARDLLATGAFLVRR